MEGIFYVFVKGGDFGANDWTLVTATLGTNPTAASVTYTTSNYFVLDFDVGDRITNIKISNPN